MTRDDLKAQQKRIFRDFFVRGPFSIKEFSDEVVTEQHMRKVADPEDPKGLSQEVFAHLFRRALAKNATAALEWLARSLQAPQVIHALAPKADGRARDVERESAEASVATSEVQRVTLDATADRYVSPTEAHEIRCATRVAMRELAEVAAATESFESAQGSLPVEVRP